MLDAEVIQHEAILSRYDHLPLGGEPFQELPDRLGPDLVEVREGLIDDQRVPRALAREEVRCTEPDREERDVLFAEAERR